METIQNFLDYSCNSMYRAVGPASCTNLIIFLKSRVKTVTGHMTLGKYDLLRKPDQERIFAVPHVSVLISKGRMTNETPVQIRRAQRAGSK